MKLIHVVTFKYLMLITKSIIQEKTEEMKNEWKRIKLFFDNLQTNYLPFYLFMTQLVVSIQQ